MNPQARDMFEGDKTPASEDMDTGLSCEDRNQLLYEACCEGQMALVVELVDNGADVNCKTAKSSKTYGSWNASVWDGPLYQAVLNGHGEIVEFLVRKGARYLKRCLIPDLEVSGHSHRSVSILERMGCLLELAVHLCCSKVDLLLEFYDCEISHDDCFNSLFSAMMSHRMEAAKDIVYRFCSRFVNTPSIMGRPDNLEELMSRALLESTRENEFFLLLILDNFGESLVKQWWKSDKILEFLFLAAEHDFQGTVEKLTLLLTLYSGQDPLSKRELQRQMHETFSGNKVAPLSRCSLPVLCLLTASGLLDPKQYPDALSSIVDCGAALSSSVDCGATMSSIVDCDSASSSSVDCSAALSSNIDCGSALSSSVDCGANSLSAEKMEKIQWLVSECGFDIRAQNAEGMAPIHLVVRRGNPLLVKSLILNGADVNSEMAVFDRMTPLQVSLNAHLQRAELSEEVFALLVSHGADLSAQGSLGYSPLAVLFWLGIDTDQLEDERRCRALNRSVTLATYLHPDDVAFKSVFVPKANAGGNDDYTDPGPSYEEIISNRPFDDRAHDIYRTKPLPPKFLVKLANKFGAALLPMGAKALLHDPAWSLLGSRLEEAGASLKHAPSLQTLCWTTIRRNIGGVHFQHKVDQLPIPEILKKGLKTI